jgi:uncharacterized membrane protein (UPF0127 family)
MIKTKNAFQFLLIMLLFFTTNVFADDSAVLTAELATTSAEKEWGLMGRLSLSENNGLLFIYYPAQKMNFWMFNTFIDLSIAFIDSHQIICEMYTIKAYPEKMDPNRPVKKLSDMDQYGYWGSEKEFFREHSVKSKHEYVWALEVNAGWFDRHQVKVGDKIILDSKNKQITFMHPSS